MYMFIERPLSDFQY